MAKSASSTCPQVPCLLNTSRDANSTSLGSQFQHLRTLLEEKLFPNIQSKPPQLQFGRVGEGRIGLLSYHLLFGRKAWPLLCCNLISHEQLNKGRWNAKFERMLKPHVSQLYARSSILECQIYSSVGAVTINVGSIFCGFFL